MADIHLTRYNNLKCEDCELVCEIRWEIDSTIGDPINRCPKCGSTNIIVVEEPERE